MCETLLPLAFLALAFLPIFHSFGKIVIKCIYFKTGSEALTWCLTPFPLEQVGLRPCREPCLVPLSWFPGELGAPEQMPKQRVARRYSAGFPSTAEQGRGWPTAQWAGDRTVLLPQKSSRAVRQVAQDGKVGPPQRQAPVGAVFPLLLGFCLLEAL